MSVKADIGEFKRGWRVLLASSIGNAAGLSGLAFYTFGVFVVPLSDAFGWTRGQASSAASFLIIGTAITAPIVGSAIDRFGARKVGLISLVGLSLGYVALTQLGGNIAIFYLAWFLMSLIGGGTTPVVWTRAISIWFDRSRGVALGLTLAGSGLAGVFGPVVCAALIATFGWQGGYVGIGAVILIIAVPVIFLLFDDSVAAVALSRAKQSEDVGLSIPEEWSGLTLRESLRQVSFWKIAVGFFFVSGAVAGLIVSLVPLLIDSGLSSLAAAQIAGSLGIAVVFGRIGVGLLLDRFSAPKVAMALLGGTGLGCLFLVLDDAPTWLTVISVMALGLAAAAEVDLVAYLVGRYFGMRAYGKVYGWQLSAFYVGASLGPVLMGIAYDFYGSYQYILYISVAIFFFGALTVGSLGKPPRFEKTIDTVAVPGAVDKLADA